MARAAKIKAGSGKDKVLAPKPIDYPELPTRDRSLRGGRKKSMFSKGGVYLGGDKYLYADVQQIREDEWRSTVLAYERRSNDFYNAYQYVNLHPIFYSFAPFPTGPEDKHPVPVQHERHLIHDQGIDRITILVVRVNPATRRIEDDPALNTATRVWFETGAVDWTGDTRVRIHDTRFDGGAKTYESAIIKVARAIHAHYGNGRTVADKEYARDRKRAQKRAQASTANPTKSRKAA
jgi:hypothetical protein